ncbi:hypothetical protein C8R46DRAFT_1356334 [Mycena filopes]|nr:hypothetical protein C8R46DRAFT_1356334 [Mycena filopes]
MSDFDEETHGHLLSTKSDDLERDTFIFVNWTHRSLLYLVGILAYRITPSGPPLDPDATEPIPPGNYGLYYDRECRASGAGNLSRVRSRMTNFALRFSDKWPVHARSVLDPFPPPVRDSVLARDGSCCTITGSDGGVLTWIIPPVDSYETDDFSSSNPWDITPFLVEDNVLTLHPDLAHSWYSNHFSVDVDDWYRIVVLHPACAGQAHMPPHLPLHARHGAGADHFLRLHFRFTLHLQLRGGDIVEDFSNGTIIAWMEALGVDHPEGCECEMAPLSDPRWQTVLGQAILQHVMQRRVGLSLEEDRKRAEEMAEMDTRELKKMDDDEDEDDEDEDDGTDELSSRYMVMDLKY